MVSVGTADTPGSPVEASWPAWAITRLQQQLPKGSPCSICIIHCPFSLRKAKFQNGGPHVKAQRQNMDQGWLGIPKIYFERSILSSIFRNQCHLGRSQPPCLLLSTFWQHNAGHCGYRDEQYTAPTPPCCPLSPSNPPSFLPINSKLNTTMHCGRHSTGDKTVGKNTVFTVTKLKV